MSERYEFIDLAKGFGIFLVVWGHTMVPRSVYIYSFHMPLFFFISGFLFRDKPWGEYLRRIWLYVAALAAAGTAGYALGALRISLPLKLDVALTGLVFSLWATGPGCQE